MAASMICRSSHQRGSNREPMPIVGEGYPSMELRGLEMICTSYLKLVEGLVEGGAKVVQGSLMPAPPKPTWNLNQGPVNELSLHWGASKNQGPNTDRKWRGSYYKDTHKLFHGVDVRRLTGHLGELTLS